MTIEILMEEYGYSETAAKAIITALEEDGFVK